MRWSRKKTYNIDMFWRFPIESGIWPVNWLFDKSLHRFIIWVSWVVNKTWHFVLLIILPLDILLCISIRCKNVCSQSKWRVEVIYKYVSSTGNAVLLGIVPVRLLLLKSNTSNCVRPPISGMFPTNPQFRKLLQNENLITFRVTISFQLQNQ